MYVSLDLMVYAFVQYAVWVNQISKKYAILQSCQKFDSILLTVTKNDTQTKDDLTDGTYVNDLNACKWDIFLYQSEMVRRKMNGELRHTMKCIDYYYK